jgi:sugar lactone lactonase YvrE
MKNFVFTGIYIFIYMVILQSCTKSVSSSNSSTSIGSTDTSMYQVDTYAGEAIEHSIDGPTALCVDSKGFLYVAETNHDVILKVDPIAHLVGPFTGSFDQPGCIDDPFGNGSPSLAFPSNLWIYNDQIYIGDTGCEPKTCTTTGSSQTIQYENPNHISANFSGVCEDYKGNVYLCDTYNGMYVIPEVDHVIAPFATNTKFGIISSMTMDADNKNIYVSAGEKIFEVSSDGSTSVVAGMDSIGNVDGSGAFARFGGAMAICIDPDNNIYVADINNNSIRVVSPGGTVTTIAGDGKEGYQNGIGKNAEFYNPDGIAFTTSGNNNVVYVSDYRNNLIRRITFPKQ